MHSTTDTHVEKCGSTGAASDAITRPDGQQGPPVREGQRLQDGSQAQMDERGMPMSDAFAICQSLGMSRSELVNMSVRQLNVCVRTARLSGQQTRALKHLRRMLKNRGYAAICRTRRVEQRGYLEEQKELIRAHIEDLEAENNEIATDIARIQRDFTGLLAWCVEYRMLTAEQIQSITGPQQESK